MAALFSGASLPLKGSTFMAAFRLGAVLFLAAPVLPFAGKLRTMRGPRVRFACERERAMCSRALSMESYFEALSRSRGEVLSRREPWYGFSVFRQRGAIGRSPQYEAVMFLQRFCQWDAFEEDNNSLG
jgi:hypothetical protein